MSEKNHLLALVYSDSSAGNESYKLPTELSTQRIPTREYQDELLLAYDNGDQDALTELLELMLPLIVKTAAKIYRKSPGAWTSLSDMIHNLMFQAIEKSHKYIKMRFHSEVPTKQAPFSIYLIQGIRSFEFLRGIDRMSSFFKTHEEHVNHVMAVYKNDITRACNHSLTLELDARMDGNGLEEVTQFESDLLHVFAIALHKVPKKKIEKETANTFTAITEQIMQHQEGRTDKMFSTHEECLAFVEAKLESAKKKLKEYHG